MAIPSSDCRETLGGHPLAASTAHGVATISRIFLFVYYVLSLFLERPSLSVERGNGVPVFSLLLERQGVANLSRILSCSCILFYRLFLERQGVATFPFF